MRSESPRDRGSRHACGGIARSSVAFGLVLIWLRHLRVLGWLLPIGGPPLAIIGIVLSVVTYIGYVPAGLALALAPPRTHATGPAAAPSELPPPVESGGPRWRCHALLDLLPSPIWVRALLSAPTAKRLRLPHRVVRADAFMDQRPHSVPHQAAS